MSNRVLRNIFRAASVVTVALWVAAGWGAATARAQAAPAPSWQTYSYPSDGFSALFPTSPTVSRKNVDTAAGPFELRSYVVDLGTTALFVGVCDYGQAAAGRDIDTMLQGAKGGALENSKSHLVREAKITLGIYRGLEFESESDTSHFYARIYMVGTTLYQDLVVYPIATPYPDTVRFLDSFQLIARTQN